MNVQTKTAGTPHWLRSAGAVLLGFVAVAVLSLATDQVFHSLGVYPPWGEPMWDPALNLLALGYRAAYAVLGSYLAARFAPSRPMLHAMILGGIGFVFGTFGAVGAIQMNMGPVWFPVALVLTTLPCAWLGGYLFQRQSN